jgi:hypothetical protein
MRERLAPWKIHQSVAMMALDDLTCFWIDLLVYTTALFSYVFDDTAVLHLTWRGIEAPCWDRTGRVMLGFLLKAFRGELMSEDEPCKQRSYLRQAPGADGAAPD